MDNTGMISSPLAAVLCCLALLVDTDLARQVWAEDADISFIHPMGHERGWAQNYGNTAVVEFYWFFDATLRHNGQTFRSQGRETQVLQRTADGAWRIVHVHYSGMPTAIPGQGL